MTSTSTAKTSPTLAAIQAAAAPVAAIAQPPKPYPEITERDAGGINIITRLGVLPGIEAWRKSSDTEAAGKVSIALAKYEQGLAVLDRAGDVRHAAQAVEELKKLGVTLDPEDESKAFFRPHGPDAAKHLENVSTNIRHHFLAELERTVRPVLAACIRARAAELRAAYEDAKRADAAFRSRWPSAASNHVLFKQFEHALETFEYDASQEVNLRWHHDVRHMLQLCFTVPL